MGILEQIWSPVLWGIGTALIVLYPIGLAVYRLYFSPVAKFPGPKLAALTFWYQFYYDVIKHGRYTWQIGRLHDEYGPIIRINPHELHIRDSEYYDILYASNAKRDKWEWSAKMFGRADSAFGTVPHALHRPRRAALNPYFSKQSVNKLEPMICQVVESLCRRFREARETGEPVNLGYAFAALAIDVITEYSFSKSYGCIDAPDFGHKWPDVMDGLSRAVHVNAQFGWLLPVMKMMPIWVVKAMNPDMMQLINFGIDMTTQATEIIDSHSDTKQSQLSIFHALLDSDLPPHEKTVERLADEATSLVAAGQVTTAFYLKSTAFHLISNSEILAKLKAELVETMPDADDLAPLSKLESLPYLRAVVLEGFRRSHGVPHRLQRISPDAPLQYQDWDIPPGTPVGMSSILMHDNPEKFPVPHTFRPERWLGGGDRLEKYLCNFSKGTRQCLGMNLAYAEIYLTLAAVFRRFEFDLFETTREDVEVAHDFFNPQPKLGSKGVRVMVK